MTPRDVGTARGVLHPLAGGGAFHHARLAPSAALAHWVQHFWFVRWDLRGQAPQLRETLPHPNVHMVFERDGAGVHGVPAARYSRLLAEHGFAFGIKFRPGGFRPFLGSAVVGIADLSLPLRDVFGDDSVVLERDVVAGEDEYAMIDSVSAFLLARAPPADPTIERVAAIVAGIENDHSITRVDDLVDRHGLGMRALQRLFADYVGASPKWVINRYRLHEAIARIAAGVVIDWAALAQDLGYVDQSHFIRDFSALVGESPAAYVAARRMPTV